MFNSVVGAKAGKEKIICISFLVLISVAFILIMPWGTDIEFHILRIRELASEMSRTGRYPVYMFRDVYNNYGYPLPVFYCSVFLLPFACLTLLGISAVSAYKLLVLAILWASFGSAYLCLKHWTRDRNLSFTGAFVYAVQPFFLIELFVRASVASALVFVFIPMILLGYFEIMNGRNEAEGVVLLSVGVSCVVMSHVASTVLIVAALFVLFVIQIIPADNRLRITGLILLAAVTAIGITAWYTAPMLEQFAFTTFRGQDVKTLWIPTENPVAMLIPMHMYIAIDKLLHMSSTYSMIGGAVVPMIVLVIRLIWKKEISKTNRQEKILLALYALMCVMLFIRWSFIEPYIAFIQFAWRTFLITSVLGTILFIMLIKDHNDGFRRFIRITVICSAVYVLIFFFGYHMVKGAFTQFTGDVVGHDFKTYTYESETADDLYIPVNVDKDKILTGSRTVTPANDKLSYRIDEEAGCVYLDADDNAVELRAVCPFIMYPGYSAVSEETGTSYEISASTEGLVEVVIPEGTDTTICVSYTGTMIQKVSWYISAVCAGMVMILCLVLCIRNRGRRTCNSDE